MRHRALRVTVVLLAVAGIGAAAYGIWLAEQTLLAVQTDLDRVERDARDLQVLGTDIRAAQQSYVATGQGDVFWARKVTALLSRLDTELADFQSVIKSEEGRAAVTAARGAVDRFRKVDARARDYLAAGQRLLASDAIFTDGLEAMSALVGQIETARAADVDFRNAMAWRAHRREAWIMGAAATGCLLCLLLLAPLPARVRQQPPKASVSTTESPLPESGELYLNAPPPPPPPGEPTPVDVDLSSAAQICTELGRVLESRDLPALLERAGSLLGASGLVVWIADRTSAELRPVLAHGYTDDIIARLGTIPGDADNATAAAFRTAETQTVRGEGTSSGAIVAPLLTPVGCLGVLAIETRNGAERREPVKALATIFAAQLATLVSTVSAVPGAAQAQA